DTFDVNTATTANLNGGSGTDDFVFADGVSLTGAIDGKGGNDTLNLGAYNTATDVSLTGSDANGYAGTDSSISGTFSHIDTIIGGTVANTLNGENTTNTWTITGANAGTLNDGTATLAFSNFGTWNGGTSTDTLTGNNSGDTFNVTGTDQGSVTGLVTSFTSMQNLKGGTGADDFVFADAAILTGTIDGVSGSDTLNLSAYNTATDVLLTGSNANGYTGTDGGISGTFSHLDTIIGGNVANTLTAENTANTWTITGADAGKLDDGTATLTFSNFGTWNGGTGTDTLTGDSGGDTFNVTGTDQGSVTGLVTSFTSMQNLTGGSGADTFNLSGGVTGTINGGSGSDILKIVSSFTAPATALTISNVEAISNNVGAVLTANKLVVSGANTITLTGAAVSALNVTGSGTTVNIGTSGNLDLLNINVGTGSVTLNSGGSITDSTAQTVTAQSIDLTAATNIGTSANPVLTAASSLTASAGTGININNSGTLTLTGAASATGSIAIKNSGALDVAGAVSASGGNVSLVTTSGNLTIGSDITASGTLTATGASGVSLTTGNLTGTTVGISATSGNIAVSGGSSTASGGTTLTAAGSITMQNFNSSGGALTIDNGGVFTLAGPLSLHSDLVQTGSGGVVLTDNLGMNGHDIQFASAVTIASGVNAAVTSGGGSISFAKTVSGADTSADLSLNSGSGNISLHDVNTLGTLTLKSSGQVTLSGTYDVGSLATSALTGSMVIGGNTSISTAGTAIDLTPASGINGVTSGSQSLAIDTGSASIKLPSVGQTTPLASLTLNGATLSVDNVKTNGAQTYNGTTQLGGALDSTTGNIKLNGNLSLSANASIAAGGTTGVTVSGNINGAKTLTLDATNGAVDLQGNVGNSAALKTLVIDAKTATVNDVTTSGNQTYGADLTLKGGTLTSSGGAIDFS
ncbi:MAG: beta strand repeat-containing protein, partial [Gammaproteobacteria bacterium]